jgi:hypothetical protein
MLPGAYNPLGKQKNYLYCENELFMNANEIVVHD